MKQLTASRDASLELSPLDTPKKFAPPIFENIHKVPRCKHAIRPQEHLKQLRWSQKKFYTFFNEFIADKDAPRIFRACPGKSMIMLSDFISGKQFLEMSLEDTELDMIMISERADLVEEALEKAFEKFADERTISQQLDFYTSIRHILLDTAFYLILGIAPTNKTVFDKWLAKSNRENTDNWLINRVFLGDSSKYTVQAFKYFRQLFRKSPHYLKYCHHAMQRGASISHLEKQLFHFIGYELVAPIHMNLFASLIKIHNEQNIISNLIKEDGDTKNLLSDTYLDNVYLECQRFFSTPKMISKKVKKDIVITASDSRKYLLETGEIVSLLTPFYHRDIHFGPDAEAFNPARFNLMPELRKDVLGLGHVSILGKRPSSKKMIEYIWKWLAKKIISDYEWVFFPNPIISLDTHTYADSLEFRAESFRARGEMISAHNEALQALRRKFEVYTGMKEKTFDATNLQEKKALYGLYKQAVWGDAPTKPPKKQGLALQKYHAWNDHRHKSQADAIKEYIHIVKEALDRKSVLSSISELTYDLDENPGFKEETTIKPGGSNPDIVSSIKMIFQRASLRKYDSKLSISLFVIEDDQLKPFSRIDNLTDYFESRGIFSVENTKIESDVSLNDIQAIHLQTDGENDIILNEIVFGTNDERKIFRCYRSLNRSLKITTSKGIIWQNETNILRKVNEHILRKKREIYKWMRFMDDLPPFANIEASNIPLEDQYLGRNHFLNNLNNSQNFIQDGTSDRRFESIEAFLELAKSLYPFEAKVIDTDWTSDKSFANHFFAGANPIMIEKCEKLPESFKDKAEADDLRQLIEKYPVFKVDYAVFIGLKKELPAPILLFKVDELGENIPIAIQIDQENQGPIFTPKDSYEDWQMAKMWARVTDICVLHVCIHYFFSHVLQENLSIALHRNLPPSHPIYQLLAQHFKNACAAARLGYEVLFKEGGVADTILAVKGKIKELMKNSWQQWSLTEFLNVPQGFINKGVSSKQDLPNYPYRDDALLIWNKVLLPYIENIVWSFYRSDKEVQNDQYLQNWISEISTKGCQGSDIEEQIDTIDELIILLTGIIYNASFLHSMTNAQMFKYQGFIPNSPMHLSIPFPTQKNTLTEADIFNALPKYKPTELMIHSLAVLGHQEIKGIMKSDERMLGEEAPLSSNPHFLAAMKELKRNLNKYKIIVEKRNSEDREEYLGLYNCITHSASW